MATTIAAGSLPIARGKLKRDALSGRVTIVTGAGRGIDHEAARSLAWLGAQVIIAEIDSTTGVESARKISAEMSEGAARFIQTDVADESSVKHLSEVILSDYGHADIVLNNACSFTVGSVTDTSVRD